MSRGGAEFQSLRVSKNESLETLKPARLSLPAAPQLEDEANYTVLVAQPHDRNRPGYVVLRLNDLLVGNGDVGAVGERDIARHLLLDGNLRPSNHGGFTG